MAPESQAWNRRRSSSMKQHSRHSTCSCTADGAGQAADKLPHCQVQVGRGQAAAPALSSGGRRGARHAGSTAGTPPAPALSHQDCKVRQAKKQVVPWQSEPRTACAQRSPHRSATQHEHACARWPPSSIKRSVCSAVSSARGSSSSVLVAGLMTCAGGRRWRVQVGGYGERWWENLASLE